MRRALPPRADYPHHDMYEMYHSETIENAFRDIDSLIATGEPAW